MLRQTRLHFVDVQLSVADRIVMVKERLSILTWRLHNNLSSEGFDDGTKEVIKNYRVTCFLKSLLVNICQKRGGMVGSEETKAILNGVRSMTGSVATVDEGDLMNHYRMFVAHLETLFIKYGKKIDPLLH